MADDEFRAVIDDLVGHGYGLFALAGIVVDFVFNFLAVHAAGGVHILDGLLGAGVLHGAVLGYRAGQGTGNGKFNHVIGGPDAGTGAQQQGE